jgi:hypothetical protein
MTFRLPLFTSVRPSTDVAELASLRYYLNSSIGGSSLAGTSMLTARQGLEIEAMARLAKAQPGPSRRRRCADVEQ